MSQAYASWWQKQRLMHYAELMRLRRPTGVWLLLWPCWWAVGLASASEPDVMLLLWFALGAALMRPAGCILNDMADRGIDGKVARTANRPLASGAVSMREAALLLVVLLGLALWVVCQLHPILLIYAAASLLLVVAYPFMKRMTYWPQAFLGLTFNLGAIFGWVAVADMPQWPALWLYAAGICWTIGYDTIYAHQDIEDDLKVGVKSTAIRFGAQNKRWIAGFYAAAVGFLLFAVIGADTLFFAYLAPLLMAWHFSWQLKRFVPKQPKIALMLFKSNATLGFALALIFLADACLKGLIR